MVCGEGGATDTAGAAGVGAEEVAMPRPVLLVHGFGQGPASWDEAAGLLEADGAFCCERFDVRAWCGQPLGAVCDGLVGHARDLAARAGAPVILVGYSMGGRIALQAVVRACEAGQALPLGALVLESAGLGPASDEERASLERRNRAWAAEARADGAEAFMERWAQLPLFASQRALPSERQAMLAAARRQNEAECLAWQHEALGAHNQASRPQALEALRGLAAGGVTVGYLAGALDRKYAQAAQGLAADLGEAVTVIGVPNSGHNIHFEQPEAFVRALRALLG